MAAAPDGLVGGRTREWELLLGGKVTTVAFSPDGKWLAAGLGDGTGGVCQVHRAECEIILCQDAARTDKGRLFVSLTRDGLAETLIIEKFETV